MQHATVTSQFQLIYLRADIRETSGAKIYHLRRCLHNHPQESCLQVLQNTAAAMNSESTLLIGEMVIPDKAGANKYVYRK